MSELKPCQAESWNLELIQVMVLHRENTPEIGILPRRKVTAGLRKSRNHNDIVRNRN